MSHHYFGHPNIIFEKKGRFRSHCPRFLAQKWAKTSNNALYTAFCTFLLHCVYEGGVLYVNSRGICNLLLKGYFWITILFKFLRVFRSGCCAMCDLHAFYRVFLIFAKSIITRSYFVRVSLNRSARVSMKHRKQSFSSYFIDQSNTVTKADFVRVLSRNL